MGWSVWDIGCCCACDIASDSVDFSDSLYLDPSTTQDGLWYWNQRGIASTESYAQSSAGLLELVAKDTTGGLPAVDVGVSGVDYYPECPTIPVTSEWGASEVLTAEVTLSSYTESIASHTSHFCDLKIQRHALFAAYAEATLRADFENNDYKWITKLNNGTIASNPTAGDVLKITVENTTASVNAYTIKFYLNAVLQATANNDGFGDDTIGGFTGSAVASFLLYHQWGSLNTGTETAYLDDFSWSIA